MHRIGPSQERGIEEDLFGFQRRDLMPFPVLVGVAAAPIKTLKLWQVDGVRHGGNVYDEGIRVKSPGGGRFGQHEQVALRLVLV